MQIVGFLFALLVVCCRAAPPASSKLLRGGTVIAFDKTTQELRVVRNGSLLIEQDRITKISRSGESLRPPAGAEVVDCTNKILTPGFIDTHRHGWQTVFKTMGSNTTLGEYAQRFSTFQGLSLFTPEDVYLSQLAGIHEALNAGVTTILDHAHHTWTPNHAKAGLDGSIDSGGRVFFAYTFQNSTPEFSIPQQLAQWKKLRTAMSSNLTTLVISYDEFTSNPLGANTAQIVKLAKDLNLEVLTTHHVEGPWLLGGTPEDVDRAGLLTSHVPVVFSHASFLTPRGAALLRASNQHISITAESEMHYGHTHPSSHLILDQASLGIDTHFTFSTDILTQARIFLQSTRLKLYSAVLDRFQVPSYNPMSVNQAFLLATRNGGLALNRTDLGVIDIGAKADILIWNGRSPALLGWADPVAAVILHASVGDIEGVLVDGGWVKKAGKLVIPGYEKVQDRFLVAAKKIQDKLRALPTPVQSGNFLTGYPYGDVLRVDALRGEGDGYGVQYVS
ncbi:hypothetical protein V8F20_005311 [Naviculisporaceae sp. PSN 640]